MKNIRVVNFEDFINEKYTTPHDIKLQRLYMLVKQPYVSTTENPLGKMIAQVRNTLFDQITINDANYSQIQVKAGIPVLNFTEDNSLIEKLLKKKLIAKKDLYNDPTDSQLVSDKVKFHETFIGASFVPKTVFEKAEAMKLQFPIIAKPAQGKSAEGIQKFDTPHELEKTKKKFDVYSEAISIKKEFRCFCFKDTIIELDERIKIDGSEDFLKKAETKTDFFYKETNPKSYKYSSDLDKLLKDCRKKVDLDFFSVDFAETNKGELFVIEMNSRTGMGVDKMIELYKLIYKDFYGKEADIVNLKMMKDLEEKWQKAYKKEKGSGVNECTTVAGKVGETQFLFKNRDRSYTPDTRIIREEIEGTEIVYYTDQTDWVEGMNEHGVGFVFSQLTNKEHKGYHAAWTVSDDPKDDSKFKKFEKGVKKILTAKDAKDAIKLLFASKKSGSFLLGDQKESYEVEIFEEERKQRKLDFKESPFYTKSNHGVLIPQAGHQPSGYSIKRASSEIRKSQAESQLFGIKDISEIPSRMKQQVYDPESSLNVFRTDREEYTISQCLMDLTNLRFFFFHDTATANSLKIEDKVKDPKIKIEAKKL